MSDDWEVWGFRVGAFFGIFFLTSTFGFLPLLIQRFIRSDDLRDRLLSLGNSMAGGLFLGAGFVHLLGEAAATLSYELGETYESYPLAMILAPLGFLLAFFVEKVMLSGWNDAPADHHSENPYGTFVEERDSSLSTAEDFVVSDKAPIVQAEEAAIRHRKAEHSHGGGDHDHAHMQALIDRPNSFLPYILVIVLSFHSIFSGLAVGVQRDVSSALPVFVAIISHKWIEAFALGVTLLRAKASFFTTIKLIGIFSLTTPLGIVVGVALASVIDGSAGNIVTAIFTALAGGTFIYVAVVDILIPEFNSSRDKWVRGGLVFLGMAIMTALIFAFDDHGHGNDDELDHDDDHGHDHRRRRNLASCMSSPPAPGSHEADDSSANGNNQQFVHLAAAVVSRLVAYVY
eukprot:TRINITY_DN4624_c0_g1_i1.p1 TRINITY_DN4624_c0_g1~~TRINITY_DN4624_c0_g1_i1.p1  ORF type:complete len:401 (-),score=65.70 TRINITY_DN4624_c0_g1_i1:24-1226(-)